jgi:Cyclic nucleotide-binding domain
VKTAKGAFDPLVFLAKVGSGKTILECRKNKIVYSQGDAADTVFYIQEGKVRLTVVSEQGKEAHPEQAVSRKTETVPGLLGKTLAWRILRTRGAWR